MIHVHKRGLKTFRKMFETQEFVFPSVNNLHEEGHSSGEKKTSSIFGQICVSSAA